MSRATRFLTARRRTLDDLWFRVLAAARLLVGRTTAHQAGCQWIVETANTQKAISLLLKNNPIMESLLDQIRPDDVFADIGANMGIYSIRAATRQPPPRAVYAFEPAPAPYLSLLRNIRLNGCEQTCHPVPVLIGSSREFAEFQMHSLDPSDGSSRQTTSVPTFRPRISGHPRP